MRRIEGTLVRSWQAGARLRLWYLGGVVVLVVVVVVAVVAKEG